tara:strand:- start:391 stop:1365 length:975 start_codon:yes stop_codon:yes gene_type:complete
MKKKILITGAAGFIGSHLSEYFINKGYKVLAYDIYNSTNSWGWLENIKDKKNLEVILGDIRDFNLTNKIVKKCHEIIHLAALISIPYSYESPLAFVRTNVEGTYNLLESARLNNKKIIVTSTSEVYGSGQYFPMDEKHPLNAQSPYAASKIAADQLALSYYRSYGTRVKIIRPFNTYGPRQSSRAIIPNIISQLISNNKEIKLGNVFTSRDLTYVIDLCEAYLKLLKFNGGFGEIYNVGTGKAIRIKEIFLLIQKIIGLKKSLRAETKRIRPIKSEVNKLICNSSLIKKSVEWKPNYKVKDGLKITIDWMKKNKNFYKTEIYNI